MASQILSTISTKAPKNFNKEKTKAITAKLLEELDELQNMLFAENKHAVSEELADILLYLVRLADKLDVDLRQAALDKLEKNAVKYPVEQVRGSARKYSDYG